MTDDNSTDDYDPGIDVKDDYDPGIRVRGTDDSIVDEYRIECDACGATLEIGGPDPDPIPYPCDCDTPADIISPDGDRRTVEERLVRDVSDQIVTDESEPSGQQADTEPPAPTPETTKSATGDPGGNSGKFVTGAVIAVVGAVLSFTGIFAIFGVPMVFVGLAVMFPRLAKFMIMLAVFSMLALVLMLA